MRSPHCGSIALAHTFFARLLTFLIPAAVACIGLAGPAVSASEEELALARLKASTSTFTEDYAAAIPPLELLVKNNDADAQNTLVS
jgi:hypothetical protein